MNALASRRAQWRVASLTVVLLATFAYFYPGGGWNQNSRFDLTRAIVEEHTLTIDSFHENTGDKAYFQGHYYSDKAPGLSLLAVPVWAAARGAARFIGKDPTTVKSVNTELHAATVAAVGLPTALAAACLFLLALEFGASLAGATAATLAFGIGTPMWCYATLFWGHATAASFLVFAFTAAISLRNLKTRNSTLVTALMLGLTAGWAVLVEYPSVIPAAMIAIGGVVIASQSQPSRLVATIVGILAGAFACALVLMAYSYTAFGSAFHTGYSYEVNFQQEMVEGLLGFGIPRANVAGKLLVGWHRGLLFLSPVVAFAPIGLYHLWRRRSLRVAAFTLAVIPVYYLLLASSFKAWEAGWTFGPRYIAPALPFLCLPLGAVWTRFRRTTRLLISTAIAYGFALSLIAVSTSPTPPDYYENPVRGFLLPAFLAGRLPLVAAPNAWNLGTLGGLSGLPSLIPLVWLWVLAAATCIGVERWIQNGNDSATTTSRYETVKAF